MVDTILVTSYDGNPVGMSRVHCPFCQRQVEVTAVTGTSDSRCNQCGRTIGKQIQLHRKPHPDESARGSAEDESNIRVFRLDRESESASDHYQVIPLVPESDVETESAEHSRSPRASTLFRQIPPPIHLAVFGLLLFLVGQLIAVWAFVDGEFAPWTIGNLASTFGVVLALWTLTARLTDQQAQLRKLKRRMVKLEQPPDPVGPPPTKRAVRKTRRTARRKAAARPKLLEQTSVGRTV